MRDTEIYREALETYGYISQTLMCLEEMAELQKELCKNARGRENKEAIAEETYTPYYPNSLGQYIEKPLFAYIIVFALPIIILTVIPKTRRQLFTYFVNSFLLFAEVIMTLALFE